MSTNNISSEDISPGMEIKTRGGQIVEVFTVRHFNNTLSVGVNRGYPLLISIDEVEEIIE